LHPYSVFVATKIADLIGSAERSIFQLLHSTENLKTVYGKKLGFAAFLDSNPTDNSKFFTIDQVFDFFFDDLQLYNFDKTTYANILQAINSFSRYYSVVEKLGEDSLKVFKTIVLMQMLNEFEHDSALTTTKINITKALAQSEISNVESILGRLQENSILILYDRGFLPDDAIYKVRLGDYDQESLNSIKEKVRNENSFEKYVSSHNSAIVTSFLESVTDVPRLRGNPKANNIEIGACSANDIEKLKAGVRKFEDEGLLSINCILTADLTKYESTRIDLIGLSKEFPNHIFVLYDGPFEDNYEQWIEAKSYILLGSERSSKQLIEQGQQLERTVKENLEYKMQNITLIFQGNWTKKTGLKGFGSKIKECIEKVYPRGFDYLEFDRLWETPREYSDLIFNNYGEPNGKKQIESQSNTIKKRILDIFKDKNENFLVDDKLYFKDDDYVRSSALYEIVSKIRLFLKTNMGADISLRSMISDLGIERPPYGLCGWIESLVITYALAEFKKENRLEVKIGNNTPLKDGSKIVGAIKDAITKTKKNPLIRYGTSSELKLVDKLISIFSIEENTIKTLTEVCIKIRDKINISFGLPLWVISYAYEGEKKADLEKYLSSLNNLIVESNRENYYQKWKLSKY